MSAAPFPPATLRMEEAARGRAQSAERRGSVWLLARCADDEQVWVEDFVSTLRMYHLSAPELHRLEMALLRLTDYGTLVRQSTFTLYSMELVTLHHSACPFCCMQANAAEHARALDNPTSPHFVGVAKSASRHGRGLRRSLDSARLAQHRLASEAALGGAATVAICAPIREHVSAAVAATPACQSIESFAALAKAADCAKSPAAGASAQPTLPPLVSPDTGSQSGSSQSSNSSQRCSSRSRGSAGHTGSQHGSSPPSAALHGSALHNGSQRGGSQRGGSQRGGSQRGGSQRGAVSHGASLRGTSLHVQHTLQPQPQRSASTQRSNGSQRGSTTTTQRSGSNPRGNTGEATRSQVAATPSTPQASLRNNATFSNVTKPGLKLNGEPRAKASRLSALTSGISGQLSGVLAAARGHMRNTTKA